jgi:site-specific DNA-methyltransferase (adenine-specific)
VNVVHKADVLDALRAMPDNSFHGCLTDPPYGLSFMGHQWDHGVPSVEVWREVLRVLRPGAHLLAFGGTRTFHRLTCAIEDAGFEIRDCMSWLYGSGFPKSLDVGKVAPAFAGHGTALKPAWEPIIVARKPLEGTVAANVQRWGCGALAIDASRIGYASNNDKAAAAAAAAAQRACQDQNRSLRTRSNFAEGAGPSTIAPFLEKQELGRWPANVVLDETAGRALDAQSGNRRGMSGGGKHRPGSPGGMFGAIDCEHTARGDSGGASRFFKQCDFSQDEVVFSRAMAMLDACNFDHASIANAHSFQPKPSAVSALSDVVTLASRGETRLLGWTVPFTTATPSESKTLSASLIATILSFDEGSSQGQRRERSFPTGSRASVAQPQKQTGTTTITISHWKSDGSADAVTFSITLLNLVAGEKGSASRFKYCAKTSKKDRNEGLDDPGPQFKHGDTLRKIENKAGAGNHHPTVKPTKLMRYLCRLVTPPGGTVLDPFMGSGSTGKAAMKEGFNFVGIDNDTEHGYFDIAIARVRSAILSE